jgi:hypothetical protein
MRRRKRGNSLQEKEDMRTFHVSRGPVDTSGLRAISNSGIKIVTFPNGQRDSGADHTAQPTNGIKREVLTTQFAELLDRRGMLPGFLGRRIHGSGLPAVTLDWLTLPGQDCFATFDFEESAARDFLLILSRTQLERDDANLNWFTDRVIGRLGSHVDSDTVQRIREWPAPIALRFPNTSCPPKDGLISLTESCFCDAFIRVALC